MGAYHGKAGFDTFSHYRSVVGTDLPFSITGTAAPPFGRAMKLYADVMMRMTQGRNRRRLSANRPFSRP
jgi:coniferyl-aldehyde dehydrogenase